MKKHRVFSLFTVIFVAFLLFQSVTIVPTGYTGVKTSFGQIQEATIQSGKLNFTIPFVQSIHTVSNKQQDKHIEAQIWGEASDKTPVYAADVIVTYQVLPEKSAWLYANVSDTKNLVGDELVASAIKSAMAELGPNEVTNRTKIEPLAQQKLAESLNQKYGEGAVFINKVVINNMDFEEAYNTAIQQKSIAQQNADKQKIENEAAIAKARIRFIVTQVVPVDAKVLQRVAAQLVGLEVDDVIAQKSPDQELQRHVVDALRVLTTVLLLRRDPTLHDTVANGRRKRGIAVMRRGARIALRQGIAQMPAIVFLQSFD